MCTVGEVVKYKQPEVYRKLAGIKKVTKTVKPKEVKISEREAEQLMRHAGYERRRGAMRQRRRS